MEANKLISAPRFVTAPEGYNGRRIKFYADPVEYNLDEETVKLRCAEPGQEGFTAWRRLSDLLPVEGEA